MIRTHPEVREALRGKVPVVALESTVISHGLPYPENMEITHDMMAAIRSIGAVPAVIGLLGGQIVIGLSDDEIQRFAQEKDILKVSRADISACLVQKKLGATTVAATMFAAHKAGIEVFATGGLGGVHRGFEETLDVSADLFELSQTPVAVVCSGVKSILDVPRTLEYLETLGVPVVGYHTPTFPLFYTAGTLPLIQRVNSPEEAARLIRQQFSLGLKGMIIANPIPKAAALETEDVEALIQEAHAMMRHQGVSGKAVTPFLLKTLAELTHNETRRANMALLKHNAEVAAHIAVAASRLS